MFLCVLWFRSMGVSCVYDITDDQSGSRKTGKTNPSWPHQLIIVALYTDLSGMNIYNVMTSQILAH